VRRVPCLVDSDFHVLIVQAVGKLYRPLVMRVFAPVKFMHFGLPGIRNRLDRCVATIPACPEFHDSHLLHFHLWNSLYSFGSAGINDEFHREALNNSLFEYGSTRSWLTVMAIRRPRS
jgi:hypothetical protein